MRPAIISFILLIVFTNCVHAQSSYEKDLLAIEQSIFFCDNDSEKVNLYFQKMDLYIDNKEYSSIALKDSRRIDHSLLTDSLNQLRFLWNASLLASMNDESRLAKYYYNCYRELTPVLNEETCLLGIIINKDYDSSAVTQLINYLSAKDTSFADLACINKLTYFKKSNRNFFIAASAVVPGLGSMLNGNVYRGMNSLLINSAVGYSIYAMVNHNLYFTAASLGASLGLKFYVGNLNLTNKLFEEKEAKTKNVLANNCENVFKNLLNKYPVTFK